jgi:hypothetical protein
VTIHSGECDEGWSAPDRPSRCSVTDLPPDDILAWAAALRPHTEPVTDIVSFGPDRPPRRPRRRLVVAGVVLTVVAAGTAAIVLRRGEEADPATPACRAAPAPSPDAEAAPAAPAALIIDCAARPGVGLDRRDAAASRGPWTVVVRRSDGSLGRHGAVVTFPVAGPPDGATTVTVRGTAGKAGPGTVTWPVAGAFARVRGDLPQPVLIVIGTGTTIVAGRPAVNPPAGYTVAGSGPYRSPAVHEIRYGSTDLGEQDALGGGLTYTGVYRGGGFEDQLYATTVEDGGEVAGRPAVMSPVFGGNGTLAWEPAPGVVAYVGYSGAALDDRAVAALRRLAQRTRPLDDARWQATDPQTADQTNEPG